MIIGTCPECGTEWDLTAGLEAVGGRPRWPKGHPQAGQFRARFSDLRCQAAIGHVGSSDVPFTPLMGPPMMSVVMTEQGVTPVRPCTGILVVEEEPEVAQAA